MTPDEVDARAAALLADLSDDERTALLLHDWAPLTARHLPTLRYVDAGSGLRGVTGATAFPAGIALAAAFDADLAARYGRAVGEQARAAGFTVLLGPTLDLARDPHGGRIAEGFGEDPHLSGLVGAAHVRGVQSCHLVATAKHFVGYDAESRRTGWGPPHDRGPANDVRIAPSALHDAYLHPFREAAAAGVWAMMTSYNRLNGRYPAQDPHLLDLPRRHWGWRGCYLPDFLLAVRDPEAALRAGLDVPGLQETCGRTARMVRDLPAGARDALVGRVLRVLVGSGLVDDPPPEPAPAPSVAPPAEHLDLAREAAVAGTVLLRNDHRALPLGADVRTLAVIGPAGPDALFTQGGAAAVDLDPARAVAPLDGIRARAGDAVRVVAAQGSWGDAPLPAVPARAFTRPGGGPGVQVERRRADGTTTTGTAASVDEVVSAADLADGWPFRWSALLTPERSGRHRLSLEVGGVAVVRIDGRVVMAGVREAARFVSGPPCPLQGVVDLAAGTPVSLEIDYELGPAVVIPELGVGPQLRLGWQPPDGLRDEAVAAAGAADAAVVLVTVASGEGMDRAGLALPGDQDDLVAQVAAANPRTVVVLNTPGPVLMPWHDDVAAVLQVWYPGERFGDALADVLFGDAEPTGRLPLTFPRAPGQLPGGHRAPADVPEVLDHAEGTAFGYRSGGLHPDGPLHPFGHGLGWSRAGHELAGVAVAGDAVRVSLLVTNPGARATTHVVQAYAGPAGDPQRLAAVRRVAVTGGGRVTACVVVGRAAFERYDGAGHRRAVPGTHLLRLARDAADPGLEVLVDLASDGRIEGARAAGG